MHASELIKNSTFFVQQANNRMDLILIEIEYA